MSFGEPPPFKHLRDKVRRASLVRLRSAVAPILANNLLPHFTDHSVAHSDRLTVLIDDLVEAVQATQQPLNNCELTVLYGTCYLHDLGLQYEKAGNTEVIQQALSQTSQRWDVLSETAKRKMLRDYQANK